MTKITGRLEDWAVDPRKFAEDTEIIIWGFCYEDIHSRFRDGTQIHTSGIKLADYPIDELKEGMVVKTRNSTYLLGKPFIKSGEDK